MSRFDEVALAVIDDLVIEGAISLGDTLKLIVEIEDHFCERHVEGDLNPPGTGVIETGIDSTPLHTEFHHHPHIPLRHKNARPDERFLRPVNFGGVRVVLGVIDHQGRSIGEVEAVLDTWRSEDYGLIEFPFEPFLYDLQVEETEKAAPETLAQGCRGVLLVD